MVLLATGSARATRAAVPPPQARLGQTPSLEVFHHNAVLPDGRIVSSKDLTPTPWADVVLRLDTRGMRRSYGVTGALPNNAELLGQETVAIPAGRAVLVYLKRVPPAAASSREVTYEYRLIVFRPYPERRDMQVAYMIIGAVRGDPTRARAEVLQVAQTWRIPIP